MHENLFVNGAGLRRAFQKGKYAKYIYAAESGWCGWNIRRSRRWDARWAREFSEAGLTDHIKHFDDYPKINNKP